MWISSARQACAAAGLLLLISACGGRTPLREAGASAQDATSGAGAAGSTSSGPAGGGGQGAEGGGPGGASPCGTLVQAGDSATFTGSSEHEHARPALVPLDDPTRVGVAFALTPVMSNSGEVPIGQNVLEAWGAWPPPGVLEPHRASSLGGQTFVAGSAGETFALFLDTEATSRPLAPHMLFSTAVVPGSDSGGLPPGVLLDTPLVASPAFVTRTSSGHLTAHDVNNESIHFLQVDAFSPGPTLAETHTGVACGSKPLVADAVDNPTGAIVAASSGKPFGSCSDAAVPIGPPTDVQVSIRVGERFLPGALVKGTDPIAALFAVPRPEGGAWVVWQEDGSSAFQMPPVMAARIDELGHLEGAPFAVTPRGSATGGFGVDALAGGFVIAWVDAVDPSAPTIVVQVVTAAGNFAGSTSFSSSPGWLVIGGLLDVLVSPDDDAVLLAWPTLSDSAQPPARIRLARFDCVSD